MCESYPTHRISHAVIPGTFDPPTLGHLDVIRRASRLFDRITVAVAASVDKRGTGTTFSLDERVEMLKDSLAEFGAADTISVEPFSGLLVDFCRQRGAGAVIKGLRAMTDFEYELQQAGVNGHLAPDIESVFVMSRQKYGYISSSVVKEVAALGGEISSVSNGAPGGGAPGEITSGIDDLVPRCVATKLRQHYSR